LTFIFSILISTMLASDWTLLVYMAADNGLHTFAIEDIVEMQRGLYTTSENINIIVYIDHAPHYKNGNVEYLKITPSEANTVTSQILWTSPDENSGTGATLLRFLNWAYPRYASTHNILSIWSHSNGWMRGGQSKWIGIDDTTGDRIGIGDGELRTTLQAHNKVYDIISLEACNAGSIEIYSEIHSFARYIVSTPDLFPSRGFAWTQILADWIDTSDPLQIANHLCFHFLDAYQMGGVYNPVGNYDIAVSISISDIQYFTELFTAITEFSSAFADITYAPIFTNIRDNFRLVYSDRQSEIDLLLFANNVAQHSQAFTPIQNNILNRLQLAIDQFVPEKYTIYTQYSFHPHSVSIWYPEMQYQFYPVYINDFHKLVFASTGWGYFLNYAFGADIQPPAVVTGIQYEVNLETLYISWQPVLDPTPVTYTININNDCTLEAYGSSFSTKITDDGFFAIITTDEAGNISETQEYTFEKPIINTTQFYVAPNPVKQAKEFRLIYLLTKSSQFVDLFIYDISGQLVWKHKIFDACFNHPAPIEVDSNRPATTKLVYMSPASISESQLLVDTHLNTGLYFAVLRTDYGSFTCKFSVIR